MAANPPEDRPHYDEAPRLTTQPERALRRSDLDIPALARYGGRLPESASPYVVRAYRAAGAEMDMLYIWRDGSHTATVNLSACCELERQVHAARRFCVQLGQRAPEQLNAQLIANTWPDLGTMSNEWLTRRIIEQRERDDHTEAMQEIYAHHEEQIPELKQWPPTLASSSQTVIDGERAFRYDQELRKMQHASRGCYLSEQPLREQFPAFKIWKAIDNSESLPPGHKREYFATSLYGRHDIQRHAFIGDIMDAAADTVQGWLKKYRHAAGIKRKRRQSRKP